MSTVKFDCIGYWSEIKLDIIRKYAQAYSTIFNAEAQARLSHVYIDAFAGAGVHVSKTRTGEILGSPLIALNTDPPFREYHFIDLNGDKVSYLRNRVGPRSGVHIYQDDCNRVLLERVFPKVRYEQYRRGLCLLDPYGLHLNWEVVRTAGQMKTIDIFLNFPIMDMNRNVLWHESDKVDDWDIERMNCFWGDDSWRTSAYKREVGLFGLLDETKATNNAIAEAFRQRLKDVAGFSNVPPPIPMRNTHGATIYYLFFASPKPVAQNIITDIFKKYCARGAR